MTEKKTLEEHLEHLKMVLQRAKLYGVRIRRKKWHFLQPSVEFLGHRVDAEGHHPLASKVQAITKAPIPRNVTELRSILGLLNYYGSFIPNFSSLLYPLNHLLQKEAHWYWTEESQAAIEEARK